MTGDIMKGYDDVFLSSLIRMGQTEEFKMLNKDQINKLTNKNTLLHCAAFFKNEGITQHLIDMGLDVDAVDSDSKTPLMTAIKVRSEEVVQLLLEANANIDATDAGGKSALEMIFEAEYTNTKILESVLRRLRRDCINFDELVERLIDAGSSMYHASFLRDIQVMEILLNRGIDINSRGYAYQSTLHAAVEMNDVNMAKWILDNGGDVEAANEFGRSALFDAASCGKATMVRLLLQYGANPNTKHTYTEYNALFSVFTFAMNEADQESFDECAELLLQYGAIPENSSCDPTTIFDYGLLNELPSKKLEYLIGQLAILDKLGKLNGKSIMICDIEDHLPILTEMEKIYELCQGLLEFKVYGKLTLHDLLTHSEDKMRLHVRNTRLVAKIDDVYVTLDKVYPYYSRMLRKRIDKAIDTVKLEDTAILVINRLFGGSYNLCYNFSRGVVSYLEYNDLEQLCHV